MNEFLFVNVSIPRKVWLRCDENLKGFEVIGATRNVSNWKSNIIKKKSSQLSPFCKPMGVWLWSDTLIKRTERWSERKSKYMRSFKFFFFFFHFFDVPRLQYPLVYIINQKYLFLHISQLTTTTTWNLIFYPNLIENQSNILPRNNYSLASDTPVLHYLQWNNQTEFHSVEISCKTWSWQRKLYWIYCHHTYRDIKITKDKKNIKNV